MTYTRPPPIDITKIHHYNRGIMSHCICDMCNGLFIHIEHTKCISLERENDQWLCIHCRGKIIIKGVIKNDNTKT